MKRLLPFLFVIACHSRPSVVAPVAPKDGGPPVDVAETWVGLLGEAPVTARLVVTKEVVRGVITPDDGGPARTLATSHVDGHDYAVTLDDERADLTLDGATLSGDPNDSGRLVLTREVRARRGPWTVHARRELRHVGRAGAALDETVALFSPVVEGPHADAMMAVLHPPSPAKPDDDDDGEWDGTTAQDFTVLFFDDRFLTLSTSVEWTGAYPSTHTSAVTFDLRTGKRLGADAFRPGRDAALVRLLDRRMHDTWEATKATYEKASPDGASCGPEIVEALMTDDGPHFTPELLDAAVVNAHGITFWLDYQFPHAFLVCTPTFDLSLTFDEVRSFVDPKGLLGG